MPRKRGERMTTADEVGSKDRVQKIVRAIRMQTMLPGHNSWDKWANSVMENNDLWLEHTFAIRAADAARAVWLSHPRGEYSHLRVVALAAGLVARVVTLDDADPFKELTFEAALFIATHPIMSAGPDQR